MIKRAYVSVVVTPEGPKRFMAFKTEAEAHEDICEFLTEAVCLHGTGLDLLLAAAAAEGFIIGMGW